MRVRVQVIVEPNGEDGEQAPIVHEVASIERGHHGRRELVHVNVTPTRRPGGSGAS
jgi:hypothetical protein